MSFKHTYHCWVIPMFFSHITFDSFLFCDFLVEKSSTKRERRSLPEAKRLRRQTFGSSSFASPCSPAGSLLLPRTRGRCSKCRRVVCLGRKVHGKPCGILINGYSDGQKITRDILRLALRPHLWFQTCTLLWFVSRPDSSVLQVASPKRAPKCEEFRLGCGSKPADDNWVLDTAILSDPAAIADWQLLVLCYFNHCNLIWLVVWNIFCFSIFWE